MSDSSVIHLHPRPLVRDALPRSESVVSLTPRQQPSERAFGGSDRLRSARLVALVCLIGLPVLAAVAKCGAQP